MPCYLFTYHGYATWLPDREEGFVKRREGLQPQDIQLAATYRKGASEKAALFNDAVQQLLIDESQSAAVHQNFRLHYVATEQTHVHVLVSWKDERPWLRVRTAIKTSFSKRLKQMQQRTWFSDGSSRKQVCDEEHFHYLINKYLPEHSGRKWDERGTVASTTEETARAVGPRLLGVNEAARKERPPQSVMLLVAAFSRHDAALDWGRDKLRERFGAIQLESSRFDFVETSYYDSSMGAGLKKTFFAFEQLIDPGELPDIKRATNDLECAYAAAASHAEERPLNLDPGYIVEGKLVLASTKDHAHRMYLRDGIYAEVTLHYQHGAWQKSPWTYPDYQRADFQAFFTACREYVKMCRRSR